MHPAWTLKRDPQDLDLPGPTIAPPPKEPPPPQAQILAWVSQAHFSCHLVTNAPYMGTQNRSPRSQHRLWMGIVGAQTCRGSTVAGLLYFNIHVHILYNEMHMGEQAYSLAHPLTPCCLLWCPLPLHLSPHPCMLSGVVVRCDEVM